MKLKTQHIIIFFTILLIPFFLTIGAIALLNNFQVATLVKQYGFEDVPPSFRPISMPIIAAAFIVLLATSSALAIWLYRSITMPLNKLKEATRNIQNNNLDFELDNPPNNEIGELFDDFDTMRLELKKSLNAESRSFKENQEMISNISHDLKTPITAIKGYCEGIIDGVADTPEKMQKYIKTIYKKTIEMDQLINELTFYSQVNTDKLPYHFQILQVSQFFNDYINEISLDLEAHNVELSYRNHISKSSRIQGDAQQLHRVFDNIICNSLKYMDKPRGFIDIVLREDDNFIFVEIIDNGRGIAPESLPYIFDRFYRADTSRNTSQGGSGIGLSIVRKIIEDHGGQANAASYDGKGTTIYFTLRKLKEA